MFQNPDQAQIAARLRATHVIAVVGLSPDPSRPSQRVASALQQLGYRIIPVTPAAPRILGERAVTRLDQLAEVLAPGEQVDIVDVFRRPEHVSAIVDDCIRLGLPAVWLQEGVVDAGAAERARAAGIFTVMDRCILRERAAID
jgi:uncharacterized protein